MTEPLVTGVGVAGTESYERQVATPIATESGPPGILMFPESLSPGARQEIQARFAEWSRNPVRPLVLDSGIRFRQLLPDGTPEPEPPGYFQNQAILSEPLETQRDWFPYLVAVSGWVIAGIVVLLR